MGRLGKDKIPFLWWGAMLVLTSCANDDPRSGRYAGPVDAVQGVCGLASGGSHSVASLQIQGDSVLFTPASGVLNLKGHVDEFGHLTASTTTPGVDHKPFLMVFEGDLRGDQIEGRYATPLCRATVRLRRAG